MSTKSPTKINQLLQKVPPGALFLSSWMNRIGVSYDLQRHYKDSAWLTPLSSGVMARTGDNPTIYGALYSLNTHGGKHFSIGAMTALETAGYSHYVPMGKKTIVLFSPKEERPPAWLLKHDWSVILRHYTTECFGYETCIETVKTEGFDLLMSSPERAFMECLYLAPQYYNLTDLYYVMEILAVLHPKKVQALLEECRSVKVKRLFLYMAEKAKHGWFSELDITTISLGSGKREIVKGGAYDKKYQITIPSELKEYD